MYNRVEINEQFDNGLDMKYNEEEYFFFLMKKANHFSVMNNEEMKTQMKHWKKFGCYTIDKNNRDIEVNGKKLYGFVVSNDKVSNYCVLAMFKLDMMVSGSTYFCKRKENRDAIVKYLQKKQ